MTETNVKLTEDNKALALDALQELYTKAATIHAWLSNDKLTKEITPTLLSLMETHFTKVANIFDYDSHLAKEKEERHQDIRNANMKIRELKEKLRNSRPTDGLPEQLKGLSNTVYKWWKDHGFNHVSDPLFTSHGNFEVKFNFMLDHRHFKITSESPVSDERDDKEHIEYLRNMGFQFADFEKGRSEKLMLIDNQHNRTMLTDMLRKRFPSIEIHQWGNNSSHSDDDIFVIRNIKAYIFDLADIEGAKQIEVR